MAINNNAVGGYQNPYMANGYYYPQAPTFYPGQFSTQPIQQTVTGSGNNMNQSGIVWIKGGDDEAKMYPVAPNTAVALWSETEPVVYLKQADATGKPILKIYDLVERVEKTETAESAEYATKEDMTSLVGLVREVADSVGSLKNDIETIKGDMYGIAGKKRVTRKVDGEEDA